MSLEKLSAHRRHHSRERRIFGLVTAKVVEIKSGNEYILDYLHIGEGEASARARVMMPMAGDKRGTYFLPLPGDEVVVAFEKGDTCFPIILGAVWNQNNSPPDQAQVSTDNNVRTIVSRSGHELTFDDSVGSEKVTIKTQGGHSIVMDDGMPGRVTISTRTGISIELDNGGLDLNIQAPNSINFQAAQINLQAGQINLQTTGVFTTSMVSIDGSNYGQHKHSEGSSLEPPTDGVIS